MRLGRDQGIMTYRKMAGLAVTIGLASSAIVPLPSFANLPPRSRPLTLANPRTTAIATPVLAQPILAQGQLQPARPAYCAPDEYRNFFGHFVRGKDYQGRETRSTYTWPKIQVRDYQTPQTLLEVLRRQDDEFSIDQRDTRWVRLDPYTPLKVDLRKINATTFRADYIQAEWGGDGQEERVIRTYGPPGAYIFEHRQGCWYLTQKLQSRPQAQTPTSSTPAKPATPAAALTARLTPQMAYADLRAIALNQGWVPVANANCKENVGGTAAICDQLPELESCSGDGYCLMSFAYFGTARPTRLSVTTYGPYSDWRTPGTSSRLRVIRWGIGKSAN
jgi:hypothetical protein